MKRILQLIFCTLFLSIQQSYASDVNVTFNVTSAWDTGYCAEITVTNNTNSDISAWTFQFDLAAATVYSVWSVNYSTMGNTTSMTSGATWMNTIPANGGTISFGYCANDNGTHIAPTNAQIVGYTNCITTTGFDNSNIPPIVTISSPSEGAIFPSGTSNISLEAIATDSDGTISSVSFEVNGMNIAATNTVGNTYNANWSPSEDGTYTILATVMDNEGSSSTYSITITIGNPNAGIVPNCSNGFPHPALVGYWQNWDNATTPLIPLDQVNATYNVVNLSFAVPSTGTTYDMEFVPTNGIPVATIINQIQSLQAQGRIVQISIGGANTTVQLNSITEKNTFVSSMLNIINTFGFDGMDIDLEGTSVAITGGTIANPVDASIIYLIDAIEEIMATYHNSNGKHLYLTMAPETAYVQGAQSNWGGFWGAYLPIIDALRDSIDLLHVQLYNSGSMFGIDGNIYTQGTADFILSQTEAVIQGFTAVGGAGTFIGFPEEKIAVGLPACAGGSANGHTSTSDVQAAMAYLMGTGPKPGSYTLQSSYPNIGGLMTWSVNWDAVGTCGTVDEFAQNYTTIFGSNTNASNSCVTIAIKVFLQGAYQTGLMQDALRSNTLLPTIEPYGTGNNEAITSALLAPASTPNDDIVDWLLVELRDKNDATSIVSKRAALLQRDGDVVDVDGVSAVHFPDVPPDDYYVAIKHRNHLGVMTNSAIALTGN